MIESGLKEFRMIQSGVRGGVSSWARVGNGLIGGRRKLATEIPGVRMADFDISPDDPIEKKKAQRQSKGYKAYRQWLTETGYTIVPEPYQRALLQIVKPENLPAIEQWWIGLDQKKQIEWDSPPKIWSNWRRTLQLERPRRRPPPVRVFLKADGTWSRSVQLTASGVDRETCTQTIADMISELSNGYTEEDVIAAVRDELGRRRNAYAEPVPAAETRNRNRRPHGHRNNTGRASHGGVANSLRQGRDP
jgi:hypothetical protein